MKITKIIAAIMICTMLVSSLCACSGGEEIPDGYQLVACDGDAFRLYVPTNWTANTAGGVTSAFYSLNENASVSAYCVDDAGEMTLEEYWAYSLEKLSASLKDFDFSGKTEKAVLGGRPAIKAVYSASFVASAKDDVGEQTYKFLQVTAQNDGKTFVLIYSAPEEYYDSHLEVIEGDKDGAGVISFFTFADAYVNKDKKEFNADVECPAGMKLISTDERAYRFFVPENWVSNERAEISAAYAPENDGSNVSLQMHMTEDESVTVAEFFAACEARYVELFDEYELLSDADIKMDGVSAKKYTYRAVIGGVEYTQMQAIVMRGAVYYVLTYTALPEYFDAHASDVEKMIENFDIR